MPPAAALAYYNGLQETINRSRIFDSVVLGVLIWEHLCTLNLEWTLVWKRGLSFMNVLFLLNRYGILVEIALIDYMWFWPGRSAEACSHFHLFMPYAPLAHYVVVNTIVASRVYAIWEKDKRVLAYLSTLVVAGIVMQAYVPARSHPRAIPDGLSACIPGPDNNYWLYWLPILVFDTSVVMLSTWKILRMTRRMGRTPIFDTLLRDGVLWFGVCLMAQVGNFIYFATRNEHENSMFLAPLASAMSAVAASRIVLNLRATSSTGNSASAGSGSSAARRLEKFSNGGTGSAHTSSHPVTPSSARKAFPEPTNLSTPSRTQFGHRHDAYPPSPGRVADEKDSETFVDLSYDEAYLEKDSAHRGVV